MDWELGWQHPTIKGLNIWRVWEEGARIFNATTTARHQAGCVDWMLQLQLEGDNLYSPGPITCITLMTGGSVNTWAITTRCRRRVADTRQLLEWRIITYEHVTRKPSLPCEEHYITFSSGALLRGPRHSQSEVCPPPCPDKISVESMGMWDEKLVIIHGGQKRNNVLYTP